MKANDIGINITKLLKINLISYYGFGKLISCISIDIYLNLISRFWYGRLMIPTRIIGINIYLNLISPS
jgi:hypothetical protein